MTAPAARARGTARRLYAHARLVATAGAAGTALTELRSAGPLALRRTGARPGAPGRSAEVHLVGAAAGPLGGDRWRLDVEVGPGAHLYLRSAAACVALPGPDGARSRFDVLVTVAAGGLLDWAPEPLVAAAGARHTSSVRVELADGAGLRWREELACGRHGEEPGSALSSLTVRHAGVTLLAHELATGPGAPGWDSPAVLGPARAAGTLLLAGTCCPPEGPASGGRGAPAPTGGGADFATMRLCGPGLLVTAVGADALAVRRMLSSAARALTGPHTQRDGPSDM